MTCADLSIQQSRVYTCTFALFVMSAFTLGGECWQARLRSRHACRTVLVKLFYYYIMCVPDRHVDISPVCVGRCASDPYKSQNMIRSYGVRRPTDMQNSKGIDPISAPTQLFCQKPGFPPSQPTQLHISGCQIPG